MTMPPPSEQDKVVTQDAINAAMSTAIATQAIIVKTMLRLLIKKEVWNQEEFEKEFVEVEKEFKAAQEEFFIKGFRMKPEDWDGLMRGRLG